MAATVGAAAAAECRMAVRARTTQSFTPSATRPTRRPPAHRTPARAAQKEAVAGALAARPPARRPLPAASGMPSLWTCSILSTCKPHFQLEIKLLTSYELSLQITPHSSSSSSSRMPPMTPLPASTSPSCRPSSPAPPGWSNLAPACGASPSPSSLSPSAASTSSCA